MYVKGALAHHMKTHSDNQETFKCNDCGKVFENALFT